MNYKTNTLGEIIEAQAAIYPQHSAISSLDSPPLTYEQLGELVKQTQSQFWQWGITREERVVLIAPANSAVTLTLSLAIASNAICIPLNPNFSPSEYLTYLQQLQPQVLVVVEGYEASVTAAKQLSIPIILVTPVENRIGWFEFTKKTGDQIKSKFSVPDSEDIAFVFQTSGSTAKPKFVPVTHKALCYSSFNVKEYLELSGDDICLNLLPLFHIHGLITNGIVLS